MFLITKLIQIIKHQQNEIQNHILVGVGHGILLPETLSHKTESTEHTIVVTETIRDTVIQVQSDSSIVQALIKCDSTDRARLEEIRTLRESSRIPQPISLMECGYDSLAEAHSNSSGLQHKAPASVLTNTSKVDSLGIYLQYKECYKEEQKAKTIETVIEKEVNVLKWWQKALMWANVAAVDVILGRLFIGLFFRKSI